MAERTEVVAFRDFVDPKKKDKDWILEAVRRNYEHGGAKNLLDGKNIQEIKNYAAGKHDMTEFKNMFPDPPSKRTELSPGNIIDRKMAIQMGIDFKPLGILQQPISAAVSVLQKQLTYVNFEAIDATANHNRQMDMDRLSNRPHFEKALAMATKGIGMPISPIQTEHNTPTIDISTMGLDPTKPDQLNLWANLFYKLRPESAFEAATEALMYWNDFKMKTDLCKRDQIYYGVSSCRSYISDITGLPKFDYIFPGHVWAPDSELPDFSDVPFCYIQKRYTVEGLLELVGKEQMPAEFIHNIHERFWQASGYRRTKWSNATETMKQDGVQVVYMEFKAFDILRVKRERTRFGRWHVQIVPFDYDAKTSRKNDPNSEVVNKWPQQTYYAYWVPGTDIILKSGKVLGSFRAKGRESISKFTILIEKTKEVSDVELCIPLVKDAQRAYIKLQQFIIMSKPRGVYVDMKFIRHAAEQLAGELGMSVDVLLTLFTHHNIMIGDTEGMDGNNEGNFPPFREIPGGLGEEIPKLWNAIGNAVMQIADITGYNKGLTGQSPNPDELVGIRKLLLQSAMVSLYPAQKAHRHLTEKVFQTWAPAIQFICRKENKASEARLALEQIIGARKISVLNDMDSLPVHHFGLRVEDAPNEEAQEELRQIMAEMLRGGRLDLSDYFVIRRIINVKDAQQLLVIKESKKREEMQQQQGQAQQAMLEAKNMDVQKELQKVTITSQGEVQEEVVKGEVLMNLQKMKDATLVMLKQLEFQMEKEKKAMQGDQTAQKLYMKHNLDQQKPL